MDYKPNLMGMSQYSVEILVYHPDMKKGHKMAIHIPPQDINPRNTSPGVSAP